MRRFNPHFSARLITGSAVVGRLLRSSSDAIGRGAGRILQLCGFGELDVEAEAPELANGAPAACFGVFAVTTSASRGSWPSPLSGCGPCSPTAAPIVALTAAGAGAARLRTHRGEYRSAA